MKLKKNNLKNEILIKIYKKEINDQYEKKLINLSTSLKLKGFRTGFIPKHIIKTRFGKNIYQEILNKLLNKNLLIYIKKEQLNIIDNPKLKEILKNNNDYVECKLEFYLYPNVNLNLTNLEINIYKSNITNDDINKEINKLRLNHGVWKTTSSSTKKDDILNITLYKKTDKNIQYILKDEQIKIDKEIYYIKNLKIFLINKIQNKEYIAYIKNNELTNRLNTETNIIYIKINTIKRKYPIDITNDFMEKIGFKNKDKTNLNRLIKEQLVTISNYISNKIKKNNIFKALIISHKFEIPQILIEKKINEKKNKNIKEIEKKTIKDIKINLILLAIKKKFNIKISQTEIKNYVQSLYGKNNKKLKLDDTLLNQLKSNMYMEKILKIIEEKIIISNKIINLNDLIRMGESI